MEPAAEKFCINWGNGPVCADGPGPIGPGVCPAPRFRLAPDGTCMPVLPEICQVTIEYVASTPQDPLPVLVPKSPNCDADGAALAVAIALARILAARP